MATDISDIKYLTIGELAHETGCKAQTIRYFEQMGMLPEPARTAGNQRRYSEAAATTLRFIRHARDLGFSQDDVRQFLAMCGRQDAPCTEADAIARRHLIEVRRKIGLLKGMERELVRMTADCHQGTIAECRVIETLGDHGRCSGAHS
jgi:DNA-binding transcriptional MerR regulator